MQLQKTYTVTFVKKISLTEDITTYYFKKPGDFTFLPGQYNRWTLPYHITDGHGSSRFFTISSTPTDNKFLTFTTKNGRSGFKKALHNLRMHDEIKIFGPMGTFYIEEKNNKPMVFLSGGMGITPFYSMVTYAQEIQSKKSLTLIASFLNQKEIIYYSELTKIAQANKNITVVFVVSHPDEKKKNKTLKKGKIDTLLLNKYVPVMRKTLFYVVGSMQTEKSLTELLTESGVTEENIITEQFTGY